jgi:hypothetical protein
MKVPNSSSLTPPFSIRTRRSARSTSVPGGQACPADRELSTRILDPIHLARAGAKPSFTRIPGIAAVRAAASGYRWPRS